MENIKKLIESISVTNVSHHVNTQDGQEFIRIHTSIGDYTDLKTDKGNEPELSLEMASYNTFIEDEDMDISEVIKALDLDRIFKTFIKKSILEKSFLCEINKINEDYE
jgi:hypothetical protein